MAGNASPSACYTFGYACGVWFIATSQRRPAKACTCSFGQQKNKQHTSGQLRRGTRAAIFGLWCVGSFGLLAADFSPRVASFSSRPPLLVSYVFALFKASCEISSYLINFVFVKTYPTSSSGLVPRLDVSRHLRCRDLVQPGARITSS